MAYQYHTETVALDEKTFGKTTSKSSEVAAGVGERFNVLTAEGWEFMQMASVPVIGKLRKSQERRSLTVAVFRKTV